MDRTLEQPVDLVKLARETTQRDIARVHPDAIKIITPAKVNLTLAVGPKGDDGFHPVSTVMHALSLHDTLYLRQVAGQEADILRERAAQDDQPDYAQDGGIVAYVEPVGVVSVAAPDIPAEKNLVFKAAVQLARELGIDEAVLSIRLEKTIPEQAGLGGGSSDAAATLVGLAHVWGFDADDPRLQTVAANLGADVAFFLRGGCSLQEGRGERFIRDLEPRKGSVVLVKPEEGLSTKAVYEAYDALPDGAAWLARNELAACDRSIDIALMNDLQEPAFQLAPQLADIRAWALAQPGATDAVLCGSGTATAVLCTDFNAACTIAAAAKAKGWWSRTTGFSTLRASVMPKK